MKASPPSSTVLRFARDAPSAPRGGDASESGIDADRDGAADSAAEAAPLACTSPRTCPADLALQPGLDRPVTTARCCIDDLCSNTPPASGADVKDLAIRVSSYDQSCSVDSPRRLVPTAPLRPVRGAHRQPRWCPLGCRQRAPSYDRPVSDSPYRVPVPRPPDPYLVAWANLRRRKAFAWAAVLLWALALTVTVPAIVARAPVVSIAAAVTVVCWVSGIVGKVALAHFRCPRCGSSFYGERRTRAPWSSACVTCGIEIGTPKYRD